MFLADTGASIALHKGPYSREMSQKLLAMLTTSGARPCAFSNISKPYRTGISDMQAHHARHARWLALTTQARRLPLVHPTCNVRRSYMMTTACVRQTSVCQGRRQLG